MRARLMVPSPAELSWLWRCGLWVGLTGLLFVGGCGSSGSNSNPTPPIAVITTDSYIVDVGAAYQLDASLSSDSSGLTVGDAGADALIFSWTKIHPTSQSQFESHCEGAEVLAETCTSNDDTVCTNNPGTSCESDADCTATGDSCDLTSGTTSPQCSDGGRCGVDAGSSAEVASFVADAPGSYTVRLLVEASRANDIAVTTLETYPSLYVVGSLFAFGGTKGGIIGEFADAADFAPGAVRGEANPVTGNLLLADPDFGLVREFALTDGSIIGEFGETSVVDAPVALAFDANQWLHVAGASGDTFIFDAQTGLRVGTFGDVAGSGESVSAIAFAPNGELLVVDGGPGQGVRRFSADGSALGILGDTASSVGRAVDLAFYNGSLFIADGIGNLVRCDADGTNCGSFGTALAVLGGSGTTAVAINPAASASSAAILIADSSGAGQVVGCNASGSACNVFGDTAGLSSAYSDIFFAPSVVPTTTTTTTTSTTTTTLASAS